MNLLLLTNSHPITSLERVDCDRLKIKFANMFHVDNVGRKIWVNGVLTGITQGFLPVLTKFMYSALEIDKVLL